MKTGIIAVDSASVSRREKDDWGMLHVDESRVSKANVCIYYGSELGAGYEPKRAYKFYRDPEELALAIDSFNGKPILNRHITVDPESPPKDAVVGSMGDQAKWQPPYVTNSLHFHDAEIIRAIESGTQCELSPSYRFHADMTPGTSPDGEQYDGVMRNINCNHLAVVSKGRTGPDVCVADQKPEEVMPKKQSLFDRLKGFLASDADPEEVKAAIKEAEDEDEKEDDKKDEASANDTGDGKDDKEARDNDKPDAKDNGEDDKKPEAKGNNNDDDTKTASDAAFVKIAQDEARKAASREYLAIRQAERDVQPVVGDMAPMGSADEVYAKALKAMNIAHDAFPGPLSALFHATFPMWQKSQSQPVQARVIASDAAAADSLKSKIPSLNKQRGA